jgi:hypothetical protein
MNPHRGGYHGRHARAWCLKHLALLVFFNYACFIQLELLHWESAKMPYENSFIAPRSILAFHGLLFVVPLTFLKATICSLFSIAQLPLTNKDAHPIFFRFLAPHSHSIG